MFMQKIKFGVAFDFEGPMVNLENGHHAAHLQTAAEVGLNFTLQNALEKLPHFLGGPDEAVAQDIYDLTHKSSPEAILKRKKELFATWLKNLKEIPTRKGLIAFLQQLTEREIPFAIGTATAKDQFKYYLDRVPFKKYFLDEKIVFGKDVQNNKPAPDVYLKTAEIMKISPRRQIVFEDSPRGVKAAITAGSLAIGLPVYTNSTINQILREAGAAIIYLEWPEVNLGEILNFFNK